MCDNMKFWFIFMSFNNISDRIFNFAPPQILTSTWKNIKSFTQKFLFSFTILLCLLKRIFFQSTLNSCPFYPQHMNTSPEENPFFYEHFSKRKQFLMIKFSITGEYFSSSAQQQHRKNIVKLCLLLVWHQKDIYKNLQLYLLNSMAEEPCRSQRSWSLWACF